LWFVVFWVSVASASAFSPKEQDLVLGNPKGSKTIVEFGDYNCIYCRKNHSAVKEFLRANKNIRLVYRQFPILGAKSIFASKVVILVERQKGRAVAEKLHNMLLEMQGGLTNSKVIKMADALGVNPKWLNSETQDPALEQLLLDNHESAERLGVRATPSFIIKGKVFGGYMSLQELQNATR